MWYGNNIHIFSNFIKMMMCCLSHMTIYINDSLATCSYCLNHPTICNMIVWHTIMSWYDVQIGFRLFVNSSLGVACPNDRYKDYTVLEALSALAPADEFVLMGIEVFLRCHHNFVWVAMKPKMVILIYRSGMGVLAVQGVCPRWAWGNLWAGDQRQYEYE